MGEATQVPQGRWVRVNGSAHWSEGLAAEIVRRTAAGESLRGICRDDGMPQVQTVCRWARERADFAAELDAARAAAGRPFRAPGVSTWCEETAAVIFDRLAAGEGLAAICRDPDMPAISTAKKWIKDRPEFHHAVEVARECQADLFFEKGWEIASAITPATALAAKVQLAHLRWHAGKLAPRRLGALKPCEPEGGTAAGGKVTNIYLKHWVYPAEDGGACVPSDRPAELVSTIRESGGRGDEPEVTLGPASWQGQAAVREACERARREAGAAAHAAGLQRWDGDVPTRFLPQWYREEYAQAFADRVAGERSSARYKIGCMASHGLAAKPEDLIQAGWTAEEAAERHPVVPSLIPRIGEA